MSDSDDEGAIEERRRVLREQRVEEIRLRFPVRVRETFASRFRSGSDAEAIREIEESLIDKARLLYDDEERRCSVIETIRGLSDQCAEAIVEDRGGSR